MGESGASRRPNSSRLAEPAAPTDIRKWARMQIGRGRCNQGTKRLSDPGEEATDVGEGRAEISFGFIVEADVSAKRRSTGSGIAGEEGGRGGGGA
jgi:hypothetical protein